MRWGPQGERARGGAPEQLISPERRVSAAFGRGAASHSFTRRPCRSVPATYLAVSRPRGHSPAAVDTLRRCEV